MTEESMAPGRQFLRSDVWLRWSTLETDQKKKLPPPPAQKPYRADARLFDLVSPGDLSVGTMPLVEAIRGRRTHRKYGPDPLTLEELSFLLWAAQGIDSIIEDTQASRRTVPSGGGRHPFETYILVNRVEGLPPALYRYLPVEHKLVLEQQGPDLVDRVHEGMRRQYVKDSAVVFLWTAIPYRTEWRYSVVAHKVIAIDAGHLCQNLYLAAGAIGAGMCAIAAYDQAGLDAALGVDGQDEFTVYAATLGKL
ncbi:MAG: SagB/ThcOx family dehydrogenase [Anaerolineae bacterium]|nr:SagB/ThcOx family dehydrogenase [Anaerolineae bacterium]